MQLQSQTPNVPLEFTQGDTVTLELIAIDDSGNPFDLTGASLDTQILGANGIGPITFPNGQHTIANQTTNRGQFALALAPSDTNSCGVGGGKQILTTAAISGAVTNFLGNNILTVNPPVPIQ